MNKHIRILLASLLMAFPMSVLAEELQQDCLDARKDIRRFEVVSDSQVKVIQSGHHRYVLDLNSCPALAQAKTLSFANGPQRTFIHNGQLFYANPVDGAHRICGRAQDRLVIRDKFEDVRDPSQSCRIVGVSRLRN